MAWRLDEEAKRAMWLELADAFNIPALASEGAQQRRVSGTPQNGIPGCDG